MDEFIGSCACGWRDSMMLPNGCDDVMACNPENLNKARIGLQRLHDIYRRGICNGIVEVEY